MGKKAGDGQPRRARVPSGLQGPRRPRTPWLLRAAGWNGRGNFDGLPARHGRHPAQLPLPEELRIAGRQLRALHRHDVSERIAGEREPKSLPGPRSEALLQDAAGWAEGLLLPDLRQDVI